MVEEHAGHVDLPLFTSILCKNGCDRPAYKGFPTCCTHCRGPEGPHARDCSTKACHRLSKYTGSGVIAIKVIKADLFKSVDSVGLMDPFATVEFLPSGSDEKKVEIGRTRSAWQANLHPVWDHMCRGAIYRGPGSGDTLKLQVMEESFGGFGKPALCGVATAKLQDILCDVGEMSPGVKSSRVHELKLVKSGDHAGNIMVQAVLYLNVFHRINTADLSGLASEENMTLVDGDLFETPVKRLGVSGGTAPFFTLRLRAPKDGQSVTHWIGKDLSRATDEIAFYERRLSLTKAGSHGMDGLFSFMFDYAGVLECAEEGSAPGAPKLQLLVLRNLRDGCRQLRMLDIKVGDKTAVAGWQGKSWFSALKQNVLDGLTNSQAEGFRLEGFDNPPPVFSSMDPLIDFGGVKMHGKGLGKKARRIMMQRMPAAEMLAHFMDVHQEPAPPESGSLTLTRCEYAEMVMSEITYQLVSLAMACKSAAVPQKWIGSSVALGFDAGLLPSRDTPVQEILKSVRVQIFDWGRSELNTLKQHTSLPAQEQADRLEYFRFYKGGITRLAWEAARFRWHNFGNAQGWSQLCISVYDFDSHSSNDLIGQASVQLQDCRETTVPLQDEAGIEVVGKSGPATVSYSVTWCSLPSSSRLAGLWRVCLLRAENLVGKDGFKEQTSDPFAQLLARSSDGTYWSRHTSCVMPRNLNPEWRETFEFPVARESGESHDGSRVQVWKLLDSTAREAATVFPPSVGPDCPQEDHASARERWVEKLDKASGRRSVSW